MAKKFGYKTLESFLSTPTDSVDALDGLLSNEAKALIKGDNTTKASSRLNEVDFNQPMIKKFAFSAPPELIEIIKDIAYHYRIEMRELYIEAIVDLVKKYENEKGILRKRPDDVRITKHNSKLK